MVSEEIESMESCRSENIWVTPPCDVEDVEPFIVQNELYFYEAEEELLISSGSSHESLSCRKSNTENWTRDFLNSSASQSVS